MNPLDRLLRDELSRCLERIAGSCTEGTVTLIAAHHPKLSARVEEAEARLAGLRVELLERYAAWQATLGEVESLWALAALKRADPGEAEPLRNAA